MSEFNDALKLANRVLDRINADPDDDLGVLARQFSRAVERSKGISTNSAVDVRIVEELCTVYQNHPLLSDADPTISLDLVRRAILEIRALRSALDLPTSAPSPKAEGDLI